MEIVSKWLGEHPEHNPANAHYQSNNIKPQQTSQLNRLLACMDQGVASVKVDGHGVIVKYSRHTGRIEVYTRESQKRNEYVESYLVDPQILDKDVDSFTVGGELAGYVDETGQFENPEDMQEAGFNAVFAMTDFCKKNPDNTFARMKVLAFRLFEVNGIRGSMFRTSDQFKILEALLRGQRDFHVVSWFKFTICPMTRMVSVESARGGPMQEVCSQDDFLAYLLKRAGTREGFVVSDDTLDKPNACVPDTKRQLRDQYTAKARANFTANVSGVPNIPNFDFYCLDEQGRRMPCPLATIPSKDIGKHIWELIGQLTPPARPKVTICAPNMVFNKNEQPKLVGVHNYIRPTKKEESVHTIAQIKAMRPQFQASLDVSDKFQRMKQEFVTEKALAAAASQSLEARMHSSAGAAAKVQAPSDPLKGETVFVFNDETRPRFTDQEIDRMYGRCKKLGAQCWTRKANPRITAIIVHSESSYCLGDGEFAKWYRSTNQEARIYTTTHVDPYGHKSANARCNYLLEECRYTPDWPRFKRPKPQPLPAPAPPMPAIVLPPAPAPPIPAIVLPPAKPEPKKERTKLWPGECAFYWDTRPDSKYLTILKEHSYSCGYISDQSPPIQFYDMVFVTEETEFNVEVNVQAMLDRFNGCDFLPLILPVRYIDARLAAFPEFVPTRDFAIIPDGFPEDYKTYWRDFFAKQ